MILTDDILLEIGFNYSPATNEFTLIIPNGPHILIDKISNTYCMYFNHKHPGNLVVMVRDIFDGISKWGIRYGRTDKINEIKKALELCQQKV
jgi:hypothetical protein